LNARRFRSFTTNGIDVHFQFTSEPFQARKHVLPKDTKAKEKKEVKIESANRRPVVKLKTPKKQKKQNNENDNEKLQKEKKEKKKRKNDGRNEDAADKRARHDNESADAPPPETKIYVPGPPEFSPQDKSSKRESVCRPLHERIQATEDELLHATLRKRMEEGFLPSSSTAFLRTASLCSESPYTSLLRSSSRKPSGAFSVPCSPRRNANVVVVVPNSSNKLGSFWPTLTS